MLLLLPRTACMLIHCPTSEQYYYHDKNDNVGVGFDEISEVYQKQPMKTLTDHSTNCRGHRAVLGMKVEGHSSLVQHSRVEVTKVIQRRRSEHFPLHAAVVAVAVAAVSSVVATLAPRVVVSPEAVVAIGCSDLESLVSTLR